MRPFAASIVAAAAAGWCLASSAAEDPFKALVRPTGPLAPAAEQARLHAPEGFTVQLFASEPMINKPINMAFDARSRLWVSSTVEYPYAAKRERWADDQCSRVKDSRDAIKILEDTDGDGRADKVVDFADGLNIPAGVLPWHKPEHNDGCIAFSIPNIWYFADTDGDGRCDRREVLFGPLGYERDTHGMCSSFRLGLDGWVYATHGFNNTSHFKVRADRWRGDGKMSNEGKASATPGHSSFRHSSFDIPGRTLTLHSGNVFRFKPDGSRVELYCAGQVNPFGLCWDKYGNLYSADCHSNPITQLIRGACYPSFGKPHDGLGFGPAMCEHSHGSTGLCGIIYIDGGIWGAEWDDHMFLGNCVTSRVNHDKITFTGSTPKANEQPDFITSDDPWFRPVDLQLGPDNALYIADFYNKIIAHYEVPLDHPGRDRERGRIWRVVKKGTAGRLGSNGDIDSFMHEESTDPVLAGWALGNRNATVARLAASVSARSSSSDFATGLRGMAMQRLTKGNLPTMLAMEIGALQGLSPDDGKHLLCLIDDNHSSLWQTTDPVALAALLKAIAATTVSTDAFSRVVTLGLQHAEPRVRFAAAEAALVHPQSTATGNLVSLLRSTNDADATLKHSVKLAICERLKLPGAFISLGNDDRRLIIDITKAVPTEEAAAFLFDEWKAGRLPDMLSSLLGIIACNGSPSLIEQALAEARKLKQSDAIAAVSAMHNGLLERGAPPPPALLAWATELAESLLAAQQSHKTEWTSVPHPSHPGDESPWCLQERKCADGRMVTGISSLDKDKKSPEKLTGILRSKQFAAPAKLSFWLCGHQGFPTTEANHKNVVRLIADDTQSPLSPSRPLSPSKPIREAFPPRNDVCQRIEWDLTDLKGRQVHLEIVDGDDGPAYAWLGITRIEPAVVSIESFTSEDEKQKQLRTLATILKTTAPVGLRDKLAPYLPKPAVSPPPPKPRPELDALMAARSIAFAKAKPDATKGEFVFKTNCAICHTIKGQGGLIGPQLDGIGSRGAERLIEDILDPNRNVDAHFFLHQLKLRDGSSASGFVRGETIHALILVDAVGNEQRIAKADVVEDKEVPQSLMPPVFGESLTERDLFDLLGFLAGS